MLVRLFCVALSFCLASSLAHAQTTQPDLPTPSPSAGASSPKPADNPGLFGEIGKLLTPPSTLFPGLKPSESGAAPAQETATEPPAPGSRIVPSIVSGRELCPLSENGAPDCRTGSEKLCRGKGYSTGKSLDTDATISCSTKPLQARGKLCGTDTYVIRAFCQ
jgi:hypothetical protein